MLKTLLAVHRQLAVLFYTHTLLSHFPFSMLEMFTLPLPPYMYATYTHIHIHHFLKFHWKLIQFCTTIIYKL